MTGNNEHQAVTGGIFYCRDSASFSVSASNELLCNLTGQCSEIGNKNIPLSVRAQLREAFKCRVERERVGETSGNGN